MNIFTTGLSKQITILIILSWSVNTTCVDLTPDQFVQNMKQYKNLGFIGSGGINSVYLFLDLKTNEMVAMKFNKLESVQHVDHACALEFASRDNMAPISLTVNKLGGEDFEDANQSLFNLGLNMDDSLTAKKDDVNSQFNGAQNIGEANTADTDQQELPGGVIAGFNSIAADPNLIAELYGTRTRPRNDSTIPSNFENNVKIDDDPEFLHHNHGASFMSADDKMFYSFDQNDGEHEDLMQSPSRKNTGNDFASQKSIYQSLGDVKEGSVNSQIMGRPSNLNGQHELPGSLYKSLYRQKSEKSAYDTGIRNTGLHSPILMRYPETFSQFTSVKNAESDRDKGQYTPHAAKSRLGSVIRNNYMEHPDELYFYKLMYKFENGDVKDLNKNPSGDESMGSLYDTYNKHKVNGAEMSSENSMSKFDPVKNAAIEVNFIETLNSGSFVKASKTLQQDGSSIIVPVLNSCVTTSNSVVAMSSEVGGPNLNQTFVLESLHKMPAARQFMFFISLVDIVDRIHKKGLVHCDIKPQNFITKLALGSTGVQGLPLSPLTTLLNVEDKFQLAQNLKNLFLDLENPLVVEGSSEKLNELDLASEKYLIIDFDGMVDVKLFEVTSKGRGQVDSYYSDDEVSSLRDHSIDNSPDNDSMDLDEMSQNSRGDSAREEINGRKCEVFTPVYVPPSENNFNLKDADLLRTKDVFALGMTLMILDSKRSNQISYGEFKKEQTEEQSGKALKADPEKKDAQLKKYKRLADMIDLNYSFDHYDKSSGLSSTGYIYAFKAYAELLKAMVRPNYHMIRQKTSKTKIINMFSEVLHDYDLLKYAESKQTPQGGLEKGQAGKMGKIAQSTKTGQANPPVTLESQAVAQGLIKSDTLPKTTEMINVSDKDYDKIPKRVDINTVADCLKEILKYINRGDDSKAEGEKLMNRILLKIDVVNKQHAERVMSNARDEIPKLIDFDVKSQELRIRLII